jgi:hypothetical protein
MVLTRRQAREEERKAQELKVPSRQDVQNNAQHLLRVDTQIEILPSATGQGTHTRWIRQDPVSVAPIEPSRSQSEEIVDMRYITPAPTLLPIPGAPQKSKGNPEMRTAVVSPPVWKLEVPMPNIGEEHEVDGLGGSSDILGSPFPGHATMQPGATPHPLRLEPTILAEPSQLGRTDTEIVVLRRAHGPSGTHLYTSQGEAIFV